MCSDSGVGYPYDITCQPRWLSGLTRSCVHSLWLLVDHCVLRNWDRILVRAVKGLISRAGMVSICPLLWQRDVKLQQTKPTYDITCVYNAVWPHIYAGAVFCFNSLGVGGVSSTWKVVHRYGPDCRHCKRETVFDAFASPMDTADSPLVTTGLPGCPYRIISYNGPALSDMIPAFGLQLHHPRFLEFIVAPESARLL